MKEERTGRTLTGVVSKRAVGTKGVGEWDGKGRDLLRSVDETGNVKGPMIFRILLVSWHV